MSGKTHIVGGLSLTGAMLPVIMGSNTTHEISLLLTATGTTIFGAILSDIDEKNSLISQKMRILALFFWIMHKLFRIIGFFLPKKNKAKYIIDSCSRATNHRGMMHWPSTIILLSLIVAIFGLILSYHNPAALLHVIYGTIGLFFGMMSHIALDMVSGSVRLLAPFNNASFGIKLIESNSTIDSIIIRSILTLTAGYLYFSFLIR